MNKMLEELNSEPTLALIGLLLVIVGLVSMGKLTAEAVDAIKWVGATYFGMHAASNILPSNK